MPPGWRSQANGAPSASSTATVAATTSGPMPSPAIRVASIMLLALINFRSGVNVGADHLGLVEAVDAPGQGVGAPILVERDRWAKPLALSDGRGSRNPSQGCSDLISGRPGRQPSRNVRNSSPWPPSINSKPKVFTLNVANGLLNETTVAAFDVRNARVAAEHGATAIRAHWPSRTRRASPSRSTSQRATVTQHLTVYMRYEQQCLYNERKLIHACHPSDQRRPSAISPSRPTANNATLDGSGDRLLQPGCP